MFNLESLKKGVYLEHNNKLMEWFCSHREARGKLGIEHGRPDKVTLSWDEVIALEGLPIQLAGKFIVDPAFDPEKRALRLVEFRPYHQPDEPVDRIYQRIKSHLRRNLGEPTLEYDGESEDSYMRSFSEWQDDEVMVMWKITRVESGEACVGEIWRKPFPKEYLKLTLTRF